jgi:biotin carboxyl carrier protein
VLAPEDGRLVKLLVEEGAAVREGQDLAIFEAA